MTVPEYALPRQVKLLYRNTLLGQAVTVLNAGLLAWVAYPTLSLQTLLLWWALAFAAASGLVWGGGGLLMILQGDIALQLFTAFILAGMASGAVPLLAADPLAFRAYIWPVVLSVAIGVLGAGPLHVAFTLMGALFLLAVSRSAHYFYLALRETWRLEHEKDQWVEDLTQAKTRAENSDRAKTVFLTNIGHELRTLINGAVGMAELLDMENLTSTQRKYLAPLRRSADQLLSPKVFSAPL